MRRLCLSTAMLITGGALLVVAQFAGASSERRGGIFKVGNTGASVQIDPQLAYTTTAWWLEYATAAKLYNYSARGALVPEVASRFKVSNGGTRYTFFIRRGFKFSDGTSVTAASFKYAFDRIANPQLTSPAAQFVANVSSVRVGRNRLIIDLDDPDSQLLAELTMPFFQATATSLPIDREVADVRSTEDLPSAGPYAFTLNDVNQKTSLRRNPYWRRGPGRTAPRNLAGVDVYWNLNEQTAFEQVKAGVLDEGPIPAAEVRGIAQQYGVNRTRFWSKPTSSCIAYVPFNSRTGLFQDNTPMRKAVNWALDRTDYGNTTGLYSATPWTHMLPPGFPGSITTRKLQPYSARSSIEKARRLAAGHYKDGNVILAYQARGTIKPAQADIIRRDLTRLGLNVIMRPVQPPDPFPPAQWDILGGYGWCSDFHDPTGMLPIEFLYGPYSPTYQAKLAAANRLTGNARLKAFGKLDLDIARNVAPVAAMRTYNNRYFLSNRVKTRSLVFHNIYDDWSIPALALK